MENILRLNLEIYIIFRTMGFCRLRLQMKHGAKQPKYGSKD